MTRAAGTSLSDWALRQPAEVVPCAERVEVEAPAWRERAYAIAKRVMDVTLAVLLLILTAPIMLCAAIAIRCTSKGPILFRQARAGLHGRPFTMYKFRSMIDGAEEWRPHMSFLNEVAGPVFKLRHDPRLTSVGRWLRRTSIDELPQLFNVLRGEMSLVGPRPLPLSEVKTGSPQECRRLDVLPGLTCLWQVSGRCEIPYDEWMQLDLLYIENRSLLLDLQILLRTIPAVLSCRGAY
ncbi:MAG TPA: sugar transferase [Phycisphaerae bacterium]|mgnify:FL=1|nr:sugar transferase [Phycisphaerae bacterium]